jgi:hypothetical protein
MLRRLSSRTLLLRRAPTGNGQRPADQTAPRTEHQRRQISYNIAVDQVEAQIQAHGHNTQDQIFRLMDTMNEMSQLHLIMAGPPPARRV